MTHINRTNNSNPSSSVNKVNLRFDIDKSTYDRVYEFIGQYPAERGGMIGRSPDGVIRHFEADTTGYSDGAAYDPDINYLNQVIKEWKRKGIQFCGFIHSHPRGVIKLSGYDIWYGGEILACFKKLEQLWLPIVQTVPNTGRFEFLPYALIPNENNRKQCEIISCELNVIDEKKKEISYNFSSKSGANHNLDRSSLGTKLSENNNYCSYHGKQKDLFYSRLSQSGEVIKLSAKVLQQSQDKWSKAEENHKNYFSRNAKDYDLHLHDRTRLIIIGCGGAASLIRNLGRMGFGEIILIDPDTISESNIATQDVYPSDIGKAKVEVLADHVVKINPLAAVLSYPSEIDKIDDREFSRLISAPLRWDLAKSPKPRNFWSSSADKCQVEPIKPKKTVLMVLTDNFHAQARGHRLGLHFGIPTICAQEYSQGIGAEVTYTVPDITPACHRCITSSRYKAYLQNNYQNDVTSEGAPIFAADFLNAILGHMVLAVAYHGTQHPRWGDTIQKLGNRNLLRIRMDNSFDLKFGNTFGKIIEGAQDPEAFFMLDTLFRPQTPDRGQSISRPVCPDCGGTGNLLDAQGQFNDTRTMRT